MKRNKKDKQFMIQFDLTNRNFLTNISLFWLNLSISVTAVITSLIAILQTTDIKIKHTATTVLFIVMGLLLFWFSRVASKSINDAKNVNKQLQKELFELYPEYKRKFH
jgi:hypothetical protein